MTTDERKTEITRRFARLYGHEAVLWTQAPGRVDLMGSHTDYNEGFVLTMAIDRSTWLAARPRDDRRVVIHSMNVDGRAEFGLDAVDHDGAFPWTNYVRGVAASLQQAGYALRGFDGLVQSSVPISSGVSSSAALEVATAMMFKSLSGLEIDPLQLALLCQKAENEFVGVNSGILDQYTSVMGEAGCVLLLDCRQLSSRSAPMAEGIRAVICDTQAKRELTGSEYSERRAQCEEGARRLAAFYPHVTALRDVTLEQFEKHEGDLPPVVAKRCRFIIEENQRVLDLAHMLSAGDRARIRSLTSASYLGARDLYEIGSREMELMMGAMLGGPGIIGARQAGAGFGGCMIALVESDQIERFADQVAREYLSVSGIDAQVYPVEATAGAGPIPPGIQPHGSGVNVMDAHTSAPKERTRS
jgi:galactokinase